MSLSGVSAWDLVLSLMDRIAPASGEITEWLEELLQDTRTLRDSLGRLAITASTADAVSALVASPSCKHLIRLYDEAGGAMPPMATANEILVRQIRLLKLVASGLDALERALA